MVQTPDHNPDQSRPEVRTSGKNHYPRWEVGTFLVLDLLFALWGPQRRDRNLIASLRPFVFFPAMGLAQLKVLPGTPCSLVPLEPSVVRRPPYPWWSVVDASRPMPFFSRQCTIQQVASRRGVGNAQVLPPSGSRPLPARGKWPRHFSHCSGAATREGRGEKGTKERRERESDRESEGMIQTGRKTPGREILGHEVQSAFG